MTEVNVGCVKLIRKVVTFSISEVSHIITEVFNFLFQISVFTNDFTCFQFMSSVAKQNSINSQNFIEPIRNRPLRFRKDYATERF